MLTGCQSFYKSVRDDTPEKENIPTTSNIDTLKTYWLEYKIEADKNPPWIQENRKRLSYTSELSTYYTKLFCTEKNKQNIPSTRPEQPPASTDMAPTPMIFEKDKNGRVFPKVVEPKKIEDECEQTILILGLKEIYDIKNNNVPTNIFHIKIQGSFVQFFQKNGWKLLGEEITDVPNKQKLTLEETVVFKLNEQKKIGQLTLTPIKVLEDRRCPVGDTKKDINCEYLEKFVLQMKVENNHPYSSQDPIQQEVPERDMPSAVPCKDPGCLRFQPKRREPITEQGIIMYLPPTSTFLEISNLEPTYHSGYFFQILEVKPDRSIKREIREEDYTFTLQIQSYTQNRTTTVLPDNNTTLNTPKEIPENYKPFLPKSNGIFFFGGNFTEPDKRITQYFPIGK